MSNLLSYCGLVDAKIRASDKDFPGMKGLFSASKDGDVQMIQDLLENVEIDVNHRDDEGQTALYTACEEGKTEIVKMLLDSNADPNICTKVIF